MASTHRTSDLAIWCPAADPAADHCSAALARSGLRLVTVGGRGSAIGPAAFELPGETGARVNLIVVTNGSVHAWIAAAPALRFVQDDANAIAVLAPGVSAADARRLARVFAGHVWPRDAWHHPDSWQALSRFVVNVGSRVEDAIEVRGSLTPARLQRSTNDSYNQIAEQFAEQWFDHPPLRELELFLRRLRRKSRVLDAGCGPGHHARILAAAGHDVVAVDWSDGMLAQARKRVPSLRVLKMNIETLTFGSSAFDAIWCAATVLHVPREHLLDVLRGFWRVLAPGGLLGLNFQVGRRSELVQRERDHRFFEYYRDGAEVAAYLSAAGFSVEASAYGETTRNTHGLDMTLRWSTLYARRC